jgi:hypothetical protein
MGTFTTKLKLGGQAFGVGGWLDPTIQVLTVGQICVTETLPGHDVRRDEPVYKEEYMCLETGVGGGTIWTFGRNIFATLDDAEAGVIAHRQAAHKHIAARDALAAAEAERQRAADLATLARLTAQYGSPNGEAP